MNLIILNKNEIKNEKVVLTDYRHLHIKDILKPVLKQELKLGLINGKIGTGKVIKHNFKETTLEVKLNENPLKPLNITLVCALPRPKTLKKIIYKATALGIKEIHFINSFKVEKAYWDSNQHNYEKEIIEALSQSIDTVIPNVYFHKKFKPFTEDKLPKLIKDKIFLADINGSKPVKFRHAVLILGPEGGFTDYEIKLIENNLAKKISLGKRILRVEDALTTSVGLLKAYE